MICDFCDKRRMVGNQRSHSNIKTKRVQRANVQKIRALVGRAIQRVAVCARCLRSGVVTKVPPRQVPTAG